MFRVIVAATACVQTAEGLHVNAADGNGPAPGAVPEGPGEAPGAGAPAAAPAADKPKDVQKCGCPCSRKGKMLKLMDKVKNAKTPEERAKVDKDFNALMLAGVSEEEAKAAVGNDKKAAELVHKKVEADPALKKDLEEITTIQMQGKSGCYC